MSNQQQAALIENPSQKEKDSLRQYLDQHLEEKVMEFIDFIPEALEKRGFKVVPVTSLRERLVTAVVITAVAVAGGVVGAYIERRLSAPKPESAEPEKELIATGRRPLGRPQMAQVQN